MKREPRVVISFLLGVFSIFLLFFVGEGSQSAVASGGARYLHMAIFIGCIAVFFFLSSFLLSRGNPRAIWNSWPMLLGLNFAFPLLTLFTLFGEPRKEAALEMLGMTVLAFLCSIAGTALAAKAARGQSK